jgi:hypothetical protein
MDLRILALTSAAAAVMTFAQTPTNYSLVTQIKCKPGKTAECEEYLSKSLHKAMQLRVERGLFHSFSLYRLVDPMPSEAGFTHAYVISSDKPFPAEASEAYRKAGTDSSGMSSEAYQAKTQEVREIVARYRSKVVARATTGAPSEKGDYARIYYLKTPPNKRAELRENMRLRVPMMEQLVKSGRLRAYSSREIMFRGEADAFDATETITYKDPQTAMDEPPPFAQLKAAFDAGNPGKDYMQFLNARNEVVRVRMVRTLKLIDVIRK